MYVNGKLSCGRKYKPFEIHGVYLLIFKFRIFPVKRKMRKVFFTEMKALSMTKVNT